MEIICSKRALAFLLPLLLLCFISPLCAALRLDIKSRGAILMNADTGQILFARRADIAFHPASTTKIATALFALRAHPKAPLSMRIVAQRRWLQSIAPKKKRQLGFKTPPYWIECGSTHVGIKSGEILTLGDLYYGTLVASGNDAANLLAAHTSGTVEQFMLDLNRYLKSIGCVNTRFKNPHGLHHPGHFTTPRDLALMTKRALKDPLFCRIVATKQYAKAASNKQEKTIWLQTNRLLLKGKMRYEKAIGVKGGYTSESKHSLVAAARDGKRRFIAVLLGAQSSDDKYDDAIALLNAAFRPALKNRGKVP